MNGFMYYARLSIATVILLVVLGNRLGLLGMILAFMLPMLVELVCPAAKAKALSFCFWPKASTQASVCSDTSKASSTSIPT